MMQCNTYTILYSYYNCKFNIISDIYLFNSVRSNLLHKLNWEHFL